MIKIIAAMLAVFLFVGSPAYADDPKNCTYTTRSGKVTPVVCSQPVKIHDLLEQPRERVESILGPGIDADKMGIVDEEWKSGGGEIVAYRGGGIVVYYYPYNNGIYLSGWVRVSAENLKLSNKSIQNYFSTEAVPYKVAPRNPERLVYCAGVINCALVNTCLSDKSGRAFIISMMGPGEFMANTTPHGRCP